VNQFRSLLSTILNHTPAILTWRLHTLITSMCRLISSTTRFQRRGCGLMLQTYRCW